MLKIYPYIWTQRSVVRWRSQLDYGTIVYCTDKMHWVRTAKYIHQVLQSCYAGTSLCCDGIQRWKSVSFHCWAAINLVDEMSNEEEDVTPLVIRSWELKWHEQWGRGPTPPFVIRSWELKWHEQWGRVPAYWDPGGSASFSFLLPFPPVSVRWKSHPKLYGWYLHSLFRLHVFFVCNVEISL